MNTLREAAEEALRWMEHARLHLTIKERMHPDGLGLYDSATEALRAALAQPKTELRDQHKAFAKWFLTQNPIAPSPEDMAWAAWKAALAEPKTELRDQHKAFTHWYFGLRGINEANFNPEYLAWAAWKAALAQPEAKPVAWESRWIDPEEGPGDWVPTRDPDFYRSRPNYEVRPLYAHPPRDEWRPASEVPEDAMFSRGAVAAIVAGAIYDFAGFMTTRPVSVSIGASDACGPVVDLITSFAEKRGLDLEEAAVQSWNLCIGRDVQPPTEGTAKCQRLEGSGEICGLTPPCPDCGPSLIDVAEDS